MADQKNQNSSSGSQNGGNQGNDTSKSAQSATLASHTSRPMGGEVTDRNRGGSSEGRAQQSQGQDSRKEAGGSSGSMGDAVSNVKEKASEALEGATEWAEDTYGRVSEWASEAYDSRGNRLGDMRRRSTQSARRMGGTMQEYVAENPMVIGVVGLAAGMLIGALLPRTRRENEAFGEWADELRHQGVRYAREATQRGREFVEESFEGDDPRFSKHESEFKTPGDTANRH